MNEKPIEYYSNSENITISPQASQVILANCSHIIVNDTNLSSINFPLQLYSTKNSLISNNTINNSVMVGIILQNSKNNTIVFNEIMDNKYVGIQLRYSSNNNTILQNNITNNEYGIEMLDYNYNSMVNNTISDNLITNNECGIYVSCISEKINITDNRVCSNTCGLCLGLMKNSSIIGNNISNNYPGYGIHIGASSMNNISDNMMINNGECGIEIYNSWENTIKDNNLSKSYKGIVMDDSYNNVVTSNIIMNTTSNGFSISDCFDNTFSHNVINTSEDGVYISDSYNNSFDNNQIINHNNSGICLGWYSFNNTIINNQIYSNNNGLEIYEDSNNNTIFHNDFIDNIINAHDQGENNWDNEYPPGGNYWDDYTGTDANGDGIGDIPYNISGGDNQDLYPLMYPITYPPVFIWVDDDFNYSTPGWQYDHFDVIQDGIDAVNENGTVYVYNGTYYENVVVDKTIDLIGENRNTTVIDSSGSGDVVNVSADWVNISSFNLCNCGSDEFDNGLEIHSNNNTIANNIITDCFYSGIVVFESSDNLIINNVFEYLGSAVTMWNSKRIELSNNRIQNNSFYGLNIYYSTGCIIDDNIIKNNGYNGIHFEQSSSNVVVNNEIISNSENGIYFLSSCTDNIVISNDILYSTLKGLYLVDSNNNLIYHNNFVDNSEKVNDNSINIWYNSTLHEGNYYSDYYGNDADGDGIGDTPYNISGGSNQDLYPLGIFNQPPIADYTYAPILPNQGETVQFNATAIDYDGTIVNYTWYFGYHIIYEKNPTYQFNDSGLYPILLEVKDDNDGTDTVAKSIPVSFDMMHITNASVGWNFISTPYNQQLDSYEFICKYDDYFYDWGLATTDVNPTGTPLINSIMFGWNRTQQTYVFERNLNPGYGCWMFAYQPVEMWIQEDTAPVDDNITDLEAGWNIVGVPHNENVSKTDILVDDTDWDTAVGNGWISDFVFGWNRQDQHYDFCDTFMPGCAYWMYAYQPCTLKRT